MDIIEEKYKSKPRYNNVQQLVEVKAMPGKNLQQNYKSTSIYSKYCISLDRRFYLDVPKEIFNVISEHIIRRNNYGHIYKETNACISVNFTDRIKAIFVFDKQTMECTICAKYQLLVKYFSAPISPERCEVVISEELPLKITFYKNNEV